MQRHKLLILHTRAYQESSLLVDAFSHEYGRSSFLAKGARRQNKRQWRAALQMGGLVDVTFNEKAKLKSLFSVEQIRAAPTYSGESFACATYLAEVTIHVVQPDEAHPNLFLILERAFAELTEKSHRKKLLRQFELSLIESLGIPIDYLYDLDGADIVVDLAYELTRNEGFVRTQPSSSQAIPGNVLHDIARQNLKSDVVLDTLKRINQKILQPYLGNKSLKSRELWKQWRNFSA